MFAEIINRLERELLAIGAVSVACFCLVAAIQHGVLPRWQHIRSLQGEVRRYREVLEADEGPEAMREQISEKHRLVQEKLERLTTGLGDPSDISALLQIIFNRAWDAGARIDKANPQNEIVDGSYVRYPILLELTATYHSFGTFVGSLEKLPHIVRVERVAVTADAAGGLKAKILVTCFLSTQ